MTHVGPHHKLGAGSDRLLEAGISVACTSFVILSVFL